MTGRFDVDVAPGGYAWWYLDAFSDDGLHGLTLIAFVGSVFSPYYAHARRKGGGVAPADDHCALNVALYAGQGSKGPRRWAMTERGQESVRRDAAHFSIGRSHLRWEGDELVVGIDEVTAPWPSRIRGTVRLRAAAVLSLGLPLDRAARHHWCPIAPCARVEVDLQQPRLRWQGTAYLDSNRGVRPLEDDFTAWDWSRCVLPDDRCAVLYDVQRRDGSALALALEFGPDRKARVFKAPQRVTLPATGWRMPRGTRSDGGQARVVQTLEDSPFYTRSLVDLRVLGQPAVGVHESLSLARWTRPVVQLMLPFRMPRRA
ncbi:MAG: carotenoid 1,2-hydratase [Comamonadaceae bacterium]|nr:MAG: carotenoid 1,2-hydratase [Comamonadaceae bacterium]